MERNIFDFSCLELTRMMEKIVGKTLGEVDRANVFTTDKPHKGMAGAVIERSVLGYGANSDQKPDIKVDGEPTEVKTTGVRIKDGSYYAKEYLAITDVSLKTIEKEEFLESAFWHKLAHLLLVFYHYDSPSPIPYNEYSRFEIIGWILDSFTSEQRAELQKEWSLVKEFIANANKSSNPKEIYPYLGRELRENLLYIDTGPRYPNQPRFRLKKPFVNALIDAALNKGEPENQPEDLPFNIGKYSDLDALCHEITERYHG